MSGNHDASKGLFVLKYYLDSSAFVLFSQAILV